MVERWPRFRPLGDTAVTIELGERLDRGLSERAAAVVEAIRADPPPGVVDAVATLAAVLVIYEPLLTSYREVVEGVRAVPAWRGDAAAGPRRRVTLPACYDPSYGLDLLAVAEETGVDPAAVVELHSSVEYFVHMLGFLPGFAYLGTVASALQLPRRREPRTRVPARSVALAGGMTAVYPCESPGGWHVIGSTPVDLFNGERDPPVFLEHGDAVRFEPVDRSTYEAQRRAWLEGCWQPRVEVR